MNPSLAVFLQSLLPQHLLSTVAGKIADSRIPWVKNFFIHQFIQHYCINMSEARIEDPEAYPTFNEFFIRQLKPHLRPIAEGQQLASPVDGTIAQIGRIRKNQLLQAKGHYFDLETLLGHHPTLAQTFYDGAFATLYLAPYNYHRVHMPLTGTLREVIYVPGKLFSVNRMTSELVPQLYSRNERLICIFNTAIGQMAVILVGALIVGSTQTAWGSRSLPSAPLQLSKGTELGYFKLGSTVILLCEKDKIEWNPQLTMNSTLQLGQPLASLASY